MNRMYLFILGITILILIIIFIILLNIIIFNNTNYYNFNIYELFTNDIIYDATTFDNYTTRAPIPTVDPLYIDNMLINSHTLIPTTNSIANPTPTISPALYIATQSSLLTKIKQENDDIKYETATFEAKIAKLQLQLSEIKEELKQKEEEKLKLTGEVLTLENQRIINNKIINTMVKGMDAYVDKEKYLKQYEKDIDDKKEKLEKLLLTPVPTLPPVSIKDEQIDTITNKLDSIEKKFDEIDKKMPPNICNEQMPIPLKEAFIYGTNELQNSTYMWCTCNDANKKSDECLEYMSCQANYQKNKDKISLIGDDLTLYMKCISKYENFPKYLIK